LHPDRKDPVEQLQRPSLDVRRCGFIQRHHRGADLRGVVLGRELVGELVGDHVVVRVDCRRRVVHADAEAIHPDDPRHHDHGLDHHVRAHVAPLVEVPPEHRLDPAAERILRAQGELIVDVHLVPRDPVEHHHGTVRVEVVERLPAADRLALHREGGDLRELRRELTDDSSIVRVH
jgi:hypothetical protein